MFSVGLVSIFVVASLQTQIASTSECSPPDADEVNFNLLPGPWYIQFDSDPIVQDTKRCFLLKDFREIPGDAIYVTHQDIIHIHNRVHPGYTLLPERWLRFQDSGSKLILDEQADSDHKQSSRVDLPDISMKSTFLTVATWKLGISSKGGDVLAIKDDIEDLEASEKDPITFITDYQTYLIVLRCANGEKAIRTFTRHPTPREEDNCKVRDVINEYQGWDITLSEAGCRGLGLRDLIIN